MFVRIIFWPQTIRDQRTHTLKRLIGGVAGDIIRCGFFCSSILCLLYSGSDCDTFSRLLVSVGMECLAKKHIEKEMIVGHWYWILRYENVRDENVHGRSLGERTISLMTQKFSTSALKLNSRDWKESTKRNFVLKILAELSAMLFIKVSYVLQKR